MKEIIRLLIKILHNYYRSFCFLQKYINIFKKVIYFTVIRHVTLLYIEYQQAVTSLFTMPRRLLLLSIVQQAVRKAVLRESSLHCWLATTVFVIPREIARADHPAAG